MKSILSLIRVSRLKQIVSQNLSHYLITPLPKHPLMCFFQNPRFQSHTPSSVTYNIIIYILILLLCESISLPFILSSFFRQHPRDNSDNVYYAWAKVWHNLDEKYVYKVATLSSHLMI